MRSFFSLLMTLMVLALLLAGGFWVYQKTSQGGWHILTASSRPTTLTLYNQTPYGLTVSLRKGAKLVHFQVAPGKSEKRSLDAGTYHVEGKVSDPDTEPFSGDWTFESGGNYQGGFKRSGNGDIQGGLLLVTKSGHPMGPRGIKKRKLRP